MNTPLVVTTIGATAFLVAWLFYRRSRTTVLRGPHSNNPLLGFTVELARFERPDKLFARWELDHGPVFQIPSLFGAKHVVLCDPKAIAHFYSKDTFTYRQTAAVRLYVKHFFGPGVLWAEGEIHKRQRKALSPAFSNAAIRNVTSIFYDCAYKLKNSWDSTLATATNSKDGVIIEVQQWCFIIPIIAFRVDSIGLAGFSHDFGALDGKRSPVVAAFDSFNYSKMSIGTACLLIIGPFFPSFAQIPVQRNILFANLRRNVEEIADDLLHKNRVEMEANGKMDDKRDKSIVAALLRAESADGNLRLSRDEIVGQNLMLVAGWSITLSITTGLPYLDGVVREILRLHPAIPETMRQAAEDDVIPLSQPIQTPGGSTTDRIFVEKGTLVRVPISHINQAPSLWGEDAAKFLPSRWIGDGLSKTRATELQGYRHLLTFVDGPRACIGRGFATTEFKVCVDTVIESHTAKGEDVARVPLIVRSVERA
ncbi:cytochrome P450 [Infundibulicybe gibba]|nr:cytochrome P450 [Infundibulicybe gibba]